MSVNLEKKIFFWWWPDLLKTESTAVLNFHKGKHSEDNERPQLIFIWLSFFFSARIILSSKNGRGQRAHHSRTHSYGDQSHFCILSLSLSKLIITLSLSQPNIPWYEQNMFRCAFSWCLLCSSYYLYHIAISALLSRWLKYPFQILVEILIAF